MQNNIILSLENIHYIFTENRIKTPVLRNVSFSVENGEFLSIIGPSGCGKSTLLRIIAGLLHPTHGHLQNKASKMSMVFQNFAIFPWLSVIENVEFGLKMAGINKEERRKKAMEKIEEVGLLNFKDKYIRELSGGMRQRVGIARALAVSPDLLLMDEPFSSLDELTAEKLRNELIKLWEKYKMTVIMVTHSVGEAVELSDKIIVLSNRPATVKKIIPVDIERPRIKKSEKYLNLIDLIIAEIE